MDKYKFSISELSPKEKKFEGVAYSGEMIPNHPVWGNLIFDISSMSAKETIPILYSHDINKIVGHATISFNEKVEVQGNITESTEWGKMVYDLGKEGFPFEESVYINPKEIRKYKKGEKAFVNGKEIEDATVFYGGSIREVSITPLGADSNTETKIFNEVQNMEKEIVKEENSNIEEFKKLFSEDAEKAFQFACSCQKTETKDSKNYKKLFEELESKFNELEKKYNEKVKIEKEAKLSERINDISKTFGEVSEAVKTSLVEMSDEIFSEFKKIKFSAPAKEEIELSKKDIIEPKKELNTVEEMKFAAKNLMKENAGMTFEQALKNIKFGV